MSDNINEVAYDGEFDAEVIDEETEELEEESTNPLGDPNDYKLIREMLKEMKEWGEMLRNETNNILREQYNLNTNALYAIGIMTDSSIEEATLDTYNEFYENYKYSEDGNRDTVPSNDEEAVAVLKEVKKLQANVYESESDYQQLQMDSNEIMTQYLTFMSSDAVIEARNKELQSMKIAAEAEKDEVKRNEMLRKIQVMEDARSLQFIFHRIEQYGDWELNNIVNAFFDDRKGNYVIDKYKQKMKRFGFSVDVYKYFFNLEENFLPDQYHVFNNLFLFSYMRFIAYADPNKKSDSMWVQSLTSAISNLVYHRYPKDDENKEKEAENNTYHIRTEALFIGLMMKYLDHFKDRYDEFNRMNSTHPHHPVRIKADSQYEESRKTALINKMNDMHISGFETSWNANKLQEFLNEQLKKIAETKKLDDEAKKKAEEEQAKSEEESEDTTEESSTNDEGTTDVEVAQSEVFETLGYIESIDVVENTENTTKEE